MNPARTFGPDLVGPDFTDYWVYVAGPLTGAAIAVGVAFLLRGVRRGPQRVRGGPRGSGYRGQTAPAAMNDPFARGHPSVAPRAGRSGNLTFFRAVALG